MLGSVMVSGEAISIASEDDLIAAAKGGDVEAFGRLFERHKDAVFSFVLRSVRRREDAEDIVQETFCRAWRSMSGFRGDSKLLTWLCKIAANLCVDLARCAESRARPEADLGIGIEQMDRDIRPASEVELRSITRNAVNDAIARLNMTHRMLVVLCDIEGFTHAEAARILGSSTVSVRVRLFRARKKLRSLLAPILEEGS